MACLRAGGSLVRASICNRTLAIPQRVERRVGGNTEEPRREPGGGRIRTANPEHSLGVVIQSRRGSSHECSNSFRRKRLRYYAQLFAFQGTPHQSLDGLSGRYPKVQHFKHLPGDGHIHRMLSR